MLGPVCAPSSENAWESPDPTAASVHIPAHRPTRRWRNRQRRHISRAVDSMHFPQKPNPQPSQITGDATGKANLVVLFCSLLVFFAALVSLVELQKFVCRGVIVQSSQTDDCKLTASLLVT